MRSKPRRAIIVIGAEEPAEALLVDAERYDEVFVIARAVPDAGDRWVIDGRAVERAASGRLARVVARLKAHGVRAFGTVGDENARAAGEDAHALFPSAAILG